MAAIPEGYKTDVCFVTLEEPFLNPKTKAYKLLKQALSDDINRNLDGYLIRATTKDGLITLNIEDCPDGLPPHFAGALRELKIPFNLRSNASGPFPAIDRYYRPGQLEDNIFLMELDRDFQPVVSMNLLKNIPQMKTQDVQEMIYIMNNILNPTPLEAYVGATKMPSLQDFHSILKCPNCGTKASIYAWNLVSEEGLDLLDLIRNGSHQKLVCPRCNATSVAKDVRLHLSLSEERKLLGQLKGMVQP